MWQVSDARAALAWLTAKLGEQARVVVWGHSLGSAVAAHMVADFDLETGGTRCMIQDIHKYGESEFKVILHSPEDLC